MVKEDAVCTLSKERAKLKWFLIAFFLALVFIHIASGKSPQYYKITTSDYRPSRTITGAWDLLPSGGIHIYRDIYTETLFGFA